MGSVLVQKLLLLT